MSVNNIQEGANNVSDKSKVETEEDVKVLKDSEMIWNQITSTGDKKAFSSSGGIKTYSDNNSLDIEESSISSEVLQAITNSSGKEIKFSIKTPGFQPIEVAIIENKNFFSVTINTNNNHLRKKIKKMKKNIEENTSQELDKRVVVSVK